MNIVESFKSEEEERNIFIIISEFIYFRFEYLFDKLGGISFSFLYYFSKFSRYFG